jgi:hypothetical protein
VQVFEALYFTAIDSRTERLTAAVFPTFAFLPDEVPYHFKMTSVRRKVNHSSVQRQFDFFVQVFQALEMAVFGDNIERIEIPVLPPRAFVFDKIPYQFEVTVTRRYLNHLSIHRRFDFFA